VAFSFLYVAFVPVMQVLLLRRCDDTDLAIEIV
jgi:hypothetical protein